MPDARAAAACPGCGAGIAPGLLACPGCHRLVHAEELKRLAEEAERAAGAGELTAALETWRKALDLLPPGSHQHQVVTGKIAALSREADQPIAPPARSGEGRIPKWLAGMGAVGLFLWKFKFVFAFVLTKAKFLLSGLTKASTFFSMLLSMGVYWSLWGWRFALGVLACVYVHEMGHVAALRRLGMPASAPMFVPGLGAFVRLKQRPVDAREDARIGLAGPLWGLAAAACAFAVGRLLQSDALGAIAKVSAWINLFNLLPVWQLDGGRGFRALNRMQRVLIVVALGACWFFTAEGLLVLLLLVAIFRLFEAGAPQEGDRRAFLEFCLALAGLSALSALGPSVTTPG